MYLHLLRLMKTLLPSCDLIPLQQTHRRANLSSEYLCNSRFKKIYIINIYMQLPVWVENSTQHTKQMLQTCYKMSLYFLWTVGMRFAGGQYQHSEEAYHRNVRKPKKKDWFYQLRLSDWHYSATKQLQKVICWQWVRSLMTDRNYSKE